MIYNNYDSYNFIKLESSVYKLLLQRVYRHSLIEASMYFVLEDTGKIKNDFLRIITMESLEPQFLHSSRFSRL